MSKAPANYCHCSFSNKRKVSNGKKEFWAIIYSFKQLKEELSILPT